MGEVSNVSDEQQNESSMKAKLQELLAFRGDTKDDRSLQEALAQLTEEQLGEIEALVDSIPKDEVAQFLTASFNDLDRYPQPLDASISRGELIDFFVRTTSARERTILIIVWFSFEQIKSCAPAEAGSEAFDYQFTRKDLEAWSAKK